MLPYSNDPPEELRPCERDRLLAAQHDREAAWWLARQRIHMGLAGFLAGLALVQLALRRPWLPIGVTLVLAVGNLGFAISRETWQRWWKSLTRPVFRRACPPGPCPQCGREEGVLVVGDFATCNGCGGMWEIAA